MVPRVFGSRGVPSAADTRPRCLARDPGRGSSKRSRSRVFARRPRARRNPAAGSFAAHMVEVRARVRRLPQAGTRCRDRVTRGNRRLIRGVFLAVWRFAASELALGVGTHWIEVVGGAPPERTGRTHRRTGATRRRRAFAGECETKASNPLRESSMAERVRSDEDAQQL
jgi:hypothetical protein